MTKWWRGMDAWIDGGDRSGVCAEDGSVWVAPGVICFMLSFFFLPSPKFKTRQSGI